MNGKHGVMTQFYLGSSGEQLSKLGISKWLENAHSLTGDAFFGMMTDKLKGELNGSAKIY